MEEKDSLRSQFETLKGDEKQLIETEEDSIEIYDKEEIRSMIYEIRGKQVMLDSDVAMLYHYETKIINKAMKRNIERFPEDFCFQLTKEELKTMWFQNGTTYSKNVKFRSEKYLPYVYTEQGIAMLSGLLKNEIAINVSINIMRAFIEMRKFIANNSNIFNRLSRVEYQLLEQGKSIDEQNKIIYEHSKKIDQVFDELQKNEKEIVNSKIFYNGQIYDAYYLIIKIIKMAKIKILIIDNYIDDSIFEMLAKKGKSVEVSILTSPNSKITKLDIEKFNKQYPTLKVARTSNFHDRFILIDNKELYHVGASLKDLGKKCFAINKMEDLKFAQSIEKEGNL